MTDHRLLKRPNFFDGKFLTAEDLSREQDYVRDKLKRHNRTLHGFGIVAGLKVSGGGQSIVVEPGLGLDCEGNELVIEAPLPFPLPSTAVWQTMYLSIRYVDDPVDLTPTTNGADQPASFKEGVIFSLSPDNPNRGHRHSRGRWLPCGQLHELTIAKLRFMQQGWRVDRRYRPPVVK
jgi:hypothetical protein